MNAPVPPRCWVVSDLHQEHEENQWDMAAHAPAEGFDVAVVAGDIHMPLTRSLGWLADSEHGPDLWVHGHVHQAADYVVQRTRVICNPRGHADERSGFEPGLIALLDGPST